MKLGTSRHSAQPVMLIGGPRDGEVWTVLPDHLAGVLVSPSVSLGDSGGVLDYELYHEHWFAAPDGWRQLAYVHTSIMNSLDTISESTIVAAIMKPWREANAAAQDTDSGVSSTRR